MSIISNFNKSILILSITLFISLAGMEEAYGTTGTITMVESLIRVDSGNNEDVIHLEIKHVNGSIYKAKPGCNKPICIFYFKNLPKGFYLVKAVTNKGREIEGKVFRK